MADHSTVTAARAHQGLGLSGAVPPPRSHGSTNISVMANKHEERADGKRGCLGQNGEQSSLGFSGWTEWFLPLHGSSASPHFGSFFRLWV